MKRTIRSVLFATLIAAACGAAEAQDSAGRRFACVDYLLGKVFIVSPQGKIEWQCDGAGGSDELWVLPNGNVLFTTGHGVKEVDRDKRVVFQYQSKSEIYACQRLANGNTFIGECNTGRLIEVDPAGKIVWQLRLLPEGKDGGHAYIRNCRRLANGNNLVTHYDRQVVREYDPAGKIVLEIPAPGGPHSAIRLPDGNTLVSCGDIVPEKARVFEADRNGKVVWEVSSADLPGIRLAFMTGLHRLPNGNTVMANWLGHNRLGTAPHVIEVTRDKKVVWTYADHKAMKAVGSVQVLDVEGDARRGEVLH